MSCKVKCPHCSKPTLLTTITDTACMFCGKYFRPKGEIVFKGTIEKIEKPDVNSDLVGICPTCRQNHVDEMPDNLGYCHKCDIYFLWDEKQESY